ncbi:class II glutamine amidotransferase [Legionella spiritensis]|uniref:Glutamine amidotransferase n=1 Tax=Legionella spiritensis TaxID=452 RepID=A0A0W0ZB84_LEGSP|nr:class II glutamine amidotransferase [Legionella spiritensis]KTD66281.1 glutamine amidotransferase [Legionella spiritensis]SNV48454.1 glutamine amidotransferase [Legionella spiritensis]
MCRLVAYLGDKVLLEEVLVKPANSIIMQSLHARETDVPTNGDGFGLGWYAHHISKEPALFKSISPAWNDQNLLHLTAKVESTCFFAHVRAASEGGVTHYNCHPFIHREWMLIHNGGIADFMPVKRHLRHLLDDDIYNWIKGETDSEHFFALFLQLAKEKDLSQLSVAADVFQATIEKVNALVAQFGTQDDSYFNICITDGRRLLATRYCSGKKTSPDSLHYFSGHCFTPNPLRNDIKENHSESHHAVLIASEKLTRLDAQWEDVPVNHMLLVDDDRRIQLRPL